MSRVSFNNLDPRVSLFSNMALVTGDCNGKDVSEKVSSRPLKLNQNLSSVGLLVLQLTPADDARTAKQILMQPCLSVNQSERTVLVIL